MTYRPCHPNERTCRITPEVSVNVRRRQLSGIIGLGLLASAGLAPKARAATVSSLSSTEVASGLRQALLQGADAAVSLLGKPGGFLDNARVRIPLPDGLRQAQSVLRLMGQGQKAEELEVALNRAAEAAVPEARTLLTDAVRAMTLQDAKGILTGGDDAATQYFRGKTQTSLTQRMLPIVTSATEKLGLVQMYNQYASQAARLGLVRDQDASVQAYVTRKALDGLYLVIGEEERAIRQDPVSAGSAILKKVFGAVR